MGLMSSPYNKRNWMLELHKKVLKVKYDGQVLELQYPKVKQVDKLQGRMKKEGESVELILDFLEELGLKREISEDMQADHVEAIVTSLTDSKKN